MNVKSRTVAGGEGGRARLREERSEARSQGVRWCDKRREATETHSRTYIYSVVVVRPRRAAAPHPGTPRLTAATPRRFWKSL
jgi:hypothetical protein